ncbi:RNA polymerase sigma factor [Actinoplanes sp. TRM 88003]|uniref:RNA polymerase sigma factor n=1 Tax=Paractinoplanes aksuensis TaxID=2939490 RepID=A0ABT1DLF3_9ACTN|nr:RNA polymerase sigma factor [Actinoplanes aksuensis]MCO8271655.1 RNA polymerase sigma factor [Actinoplanes aksuensis]
MREQRDRRRYEEVYASTYADLVRFVVRRGHPVDQAEDVVAEAFVVAWQRLADLPGAHGEARAWLFGITRRLLLAKHRTENRGRLQIAGPVAMAGHDDLVATSVDLASAWTRLGPAHQEALSLSVWEGLSAAQAAKVLGVSPVAFRIRLSRARRLLKQHLAVPTPMPSASEKGYA